ncbi:MAG TPA: T9SS type A sorting domain-containing protein [Bacteroidales bacterium]|nr:T9SS type A sorting domain-containing protein [Bacteroidales bacterium]HPS17337.1 T9SS type A sorting domain-containing protein [Bacteroidales bacterium]
MKKLLLTLFISSSISLTLFGQKQTISSVAPGAWLSPATWDCNCVPAPGYIIEVNHNVILNTNFGYTYGSVNINAGASLIKFGDLVDFAIGGGSFTNEGAFEVARFYSSGGTVTNSGTMTVTQALYNTTTFSNNGIINDVDSLRNDGTIENIQNSEINSTYFWNNGNLNNDGRLKLTNFLNSVSYTGNGTIYTTDFLNTGTATTHDSVIVNYDFMNKGSFQNLSTVPFNVYHDFYNGDSLSHDAVFTNNGFVNISNNFTNADTLKGSSGSFCIAAYSTNSGYIKGTVDICDQSPLSGPPYIDLNNGVVENTVTSCTHSCSAGIDVISNNIEGIEVFPNPYSDNATFIYHSPSTTNASLVIYDITGNAIITKNFTSDGTIKITNELPSGIYFYIVRNAEGTIHSGKLISL